MPSLSLTVIKADERRGGSSLYGDERRDGSSSNGQRVGNCVTARQGDGQLGQLGVGIDGSGIVVCSFRGDGLRDR